MGEVVISALTAAGWGVLSAVSLLIGALIGVTRNPSKSVRAMLMAYGSGALVEALSIELFAHILQLAEGGSDSSGGHRRLAGNGGGPGKHLIYVAMGMALVGGGCFAGLNKALNDAGGFARKASSLKAQVGKRRLIFYARLAAKLKLVPMFGECLTAQELREVASKMKKDFFEEGEIIFHDEDMHSPIYFLLSGTVKIDIFRDADGQPDSSGSPLRQCSAPPSSAFAAKGSVSFRCEPDEDVVGASYLIEGQQLFGELVLFTGQAVKAQGVAATDSCALKLLANDFIDLLQSNAKFRRFFANCAVEGIKHSNLLKGMPPTCIKTLATVMTEIIFLTDELIYERVDEDSPLYYLVLGHVELTYPSEDGSSTSTRQVVRAGSLFGTDQLFSGKDTEVVAIAIDRALALRIDRADIDTLDRQTGKFRQTLVKAQESSSGVVPYMTEDDQSSTGVTEEDTIAPLPLPQRDQQLYLPGEVDSQGDSPTSFLRQTSNASVSCRKSRMRAASKVSCDSAGPGRTLDQRWLSKASCESHSPRRKHDPRFSGEKAALASNHGIGCEPEISDAEILQIPAHGSEHTGEHGVSHKKAHAAIMIWLGILIDAVPESLVLGILSSTATSGSLLTFVIGVFLSNLPEAMSSSATMAACGIARIRILIMWSSIVVLTGVGAALGAVIFPPGSEDSHSALFAIVAIEGMCGGAMLTMIANTALPEAFEQGGDVVGLSTLSGFLSALFVRVVSS